LIELTEENLQDQDFDEEQVEAILSSWTNQLSGIAIKITYEDVLGDIIANCERHF
jgi:hypothetical protein